MVNNESIALITRETYSFNNSSVFYSLINGAFLPYYQTVIRQSQQWLDGYSPSFHKEDMVSSRIASKLMYGFANSVFGRGLVFAKGKNTTSTDALDFISHEWSDDSDFQNAVKQLISYCLPLGTAALKINKDGEGKYWCEALRNDYFFYTTGRKRKVESFTSFIRCFQSVDDENENYFMVEKRYFRTRPDKFTQEINGKMVEFTKKDPIVEPVVVYKIYKYTGMVNNNTMPTSINESNSVNYKVLPQYVKDALKTYYGAVILDKEVVLPFGGRELGVRLFFNEGGDITNPTLPVGRALVFDCLSDFMEYDMEKSYSVRDLFNSKGIVGIPKALTQSKFVPGTGNGLTQCDSAYTKLNITGYEEVNGLDPQTQKPIITQFEIRAQEHELKQMAILKSIAITVGVSPRAIASFLVQAGEKTDDQIQSEDDTITQWIKTHRQDYIRGLNEIVEIILNQNGYSDNVEVKFANDGLLKGDKQLENIKNRMDMGMLTLEDAIREYYPDMDEVQLEDKINKALAQKQQQEQQQQNQFMNDYDNPFESGNDGNEEIENQFK